MTQLIVTSGIGAQTALKLILKHGSLKGVLDNLDKAKYPTPDPFPYEEAQRLFKGMHASLFFEPCPLPATTPAGRDAI